MMAISYMKGIIFRFRWLTMTQRKRYVYLWQRGGSLKAVRR